MDLALDFYNIWLIQADPRWSQHQHQDNWFNICCIYIYNIYIIYINNIDIDIWTPNPYQQSISVYHIMRHLFGSVLVKRSKIIVRSFLNLNSRRICQGMSEANTPSPSWRHGCWDFCSSHPILVAWLWRCTFRVYVFFFMFFLRPATSHSDCAGRE